MNLDGIMTDQRTSRLQVTSVNGFFTSSYTLWLMGKRLHQGGRVSVTQAELTAVVYTSSEQKVDFKGFRAYMSGPQQCEDHLVGATCGANLAPSDMYKSEAQTRKLIYMAAAI